MDETTHVFDRNVDLFACIAVRDYKDTLAWYENLFGCPPTYIASEEEALWELAEHRSIAIELRPDRAGYAMHTIFIEQFDEFIESVDKRGIKPFHTETYSNGIRKVIYRDPEGNELGFGGAPTLVR